jgi:hypothetical protein
MLEKGAKIKICRKFQGGKKPVNEEYLLNCSGRQFSFFVSFGIETKSLAADESQRIKRRRWGGNEAAKAPLWLWESRGGSGK